LFNCLWFREISDRSSDAPGEARADAVLASMSVDSHAMYA
jgi:hypothetical protein